MPTTISDSIGGIKKITMYQFFILICRSQAQASKNAKAF